MPLKAVLIFGGHYEWNTKSGEMVGLVTEFEVDEEYLGRFEEKLVGGRSHRELWVPAEELAEFNRHIRGKIRVVAVFYGEGYGGRDFSGLISDGSGE